jgi:EAL domain-containing protein (putative c-di-GMP-specific phosphodiesterase class I)
MAVVDRGIELAEQREFPGGVGERSVGNRLGSALVAAAEAAAEGAKWREFDKAKLADAAWKLSLLSQLDAAIDDGHLWVAYQPKLDLATRTIVGAEALVRWTHPEKGAISPIEFVAAAEQHNRIERLTQHVLHRAVLAAATINAHDIDFSIAVNLSARLLETRDIVTMVADALAAHRLEPHRLTLEITETAALVGGNSLAILNELRALGLHISIDDYGTGLSTLEYLKKIPASEIKIDRSFVQAMLSSSSDLLMINSTIQLAHSLGHKVVAEGCETDEVIVRLGELGCDIAQGYRIGRPMTFQDLARRILAERKHAA